MPSNDVITEEQIRRALADAIKIVQLHGKIYMPLVNRLAKELRAVQERRELMAEAMAQIESPLIELRAG